MAAKWRIPMFSLSQAHTHRYCSLVQGNRLWLCDFLQFKSQNGRTFRNIELLHPLMIHLVPEKDLSHPIGSLVASGEKPVAATTRPSGGWPVSKFSRQEAVFAWQVLVLMDSSKKKNLPQPPTCDRKAQAAPVRRVALNYSYVLITSALK